jgi:hypothetical protein
MLTCQIKPPASPYMISFHFQHAAARHQYRAACHMHDQSRNAASKRTEIADLLVASDFDLNWRPKPS